MRLTSAMALAILATGGFLVTLAFARDHALLALYAYVLFLGVVIAAVLARRIGRGLPETIPFQELTAIRSGQDAEQLPEFGMLSRRLRLAKASESEMARHLRPLLRQVAAARLARTYGITNPDEQTDRVRSLLGDQLWQIVRPDWQRRHEPFQGGLERPEIEQLISRLESIG
jgi:hypothetical protein